MSGWIRISVLPIGAIGGGGGGGGGGGKNAGVPTS